MQRVIITFGTFDVFHIGHLNILEAASCLGSKLIVGVSSDEFTYRKKQQYPIYSEYERCRIVAALTCVASVFLEESFEKKHQYILSNEADVMVMGDDWQGKFDEFKDICDVIYLPRTPSISTTAIIEKIRS